ncbi:hypothetical protein JVU11DRAFT_6848 [Chiua virens]|nr:hypothetical protein JVU11DRAFT_6848 [Chiua virens]
MVSLRSGLTSVLTVLTVLGATQAIPLTHKLRRLSPSARDVLKRATPAAPHFLTYSDIYLNTFPSASELQGFNVFALSFLLTSGSVDQAQNWESLSSSQRSSFMQEYNAAGISVIVSAFGSTESPTTSGANAVTTANNMASWVTQNGVNGIDVDYEDMTAFNGGGGSAESWLITFTQQLRQNLPQGQYILTHARGSFSPSMWSGGGYLAIDKSVGALIDWYNIQVSTIFGLQQRLLF